MPHDLRVQSECAAFRADSLSRGTQASLKESITVLRGWLYRTNIDNSKIGEANNCPVTTRIAGSILLAAVFTALICRADTAQSSLEQANNVVRGEARCSILGCILYSRRVMCASQTTHSGIQQYSQTIRCYGRYLATSGRIQRVLKLLSGGR